MGEFYCNMRVTKGIDGVLHFTTSVNRKTILIDHKTINMALHLPIKLTDHEHPCLDIYSYFMFNKEEFQLMLSNFCDSDVPSGLCDKPCSIHYKHFNPMFQQLALIVRANVLPKPNQSKFLDFYDMKVMFLLYNNKINFNISYVILLNLINVNLVEYMPYGLMITSILNLCHVSTPFDQATIVDSCLTPAHTRNQVSLTLCEPQNVFPVNLPQNIREEDVYLSNNESVKMLFEEQKMELRRLKTENEDIKRRLGFIESLAAFTMGQNRVMDMEIMNQFQVQMVNNVGMVNELETVGDGNENLDSNGLPDLVGELGFVAAMDDAMG